MKDEWNLSDKITYAKEIDQILNIGDVKEFIKRLKEEVPFGDRGILMERVIDKLAGDKLIEEEGD